MKKSATLLLVTVLVVSSLVVVGSVCAQSVPAPSAPEFTVKFVNASYTVTTTNSYTGVNETEQVSNNSVEITITNQPFSHPGYQIYYNVRVRPHFDGNWTEVYSLRTYASSYDGDYDFSYAQYISENSMPQSESSYTIITFSVVPTNLYLGSGYDVGGTSLRAIPDGSQIDFQVEALVGHPSQRWVSDHALYPMLGGHSESAVAYDGTSGWSKTQTVTIGELQTTATPSPSVSPTPTSSPETTPTPDQEPQQTQIETIAGVAIMTLVFGAALGLLVYLIKRK